MAPHCVTDKVQAHLKDCGLDLYYPTGGARRALRVGFHSLRHSAATLWQRAGAPQHEVAEILERVHNKVNAATEAELLAMLRTRRHGRHRGQEPDAGATAGALSAAHIRRVSRSRTRP